MPRRGSLGLVGFVALAGCAGAPGSGDGSKIAVGDQILVANATTGEQCRVRKLRDVDVGLEVEDFDIICEGWRQPSGLLRRAVLRDNTPLEPFVTRPELALYNTETARCDPPVPAASTGGEAIARRCTGADGWPLLIIAARTASDPGTILVAQGLPQIASIIEALAIQGSPGAAQTEVLRGGSRSPLVELAARSSEVNGKPVSLDEIMDYRQLVDLGRAYNQAGDFTTAVASYERALVLVRDHQGAGSSGSIPLLSALGLNLANDGRSGDAAAAFDEAETIGDRAGWGAAKPQYRSYRAAFERRQGNLEQADQLVTAAVRERSRVAEIPSPSLANSLAVEAGILSDLGRTDEALADIDRAIGIAKRENDYAAQSFFYLRRASLQRAAGDLTSARRAAEISEKLTIELFGEGPNLAEVLIERGKIEAAAGNRKAARDAYGRAITIMAAIPSTTKALSAADVAPYLDVLLAGENGGPPSQEDLSRALAAVQLVKAPVFERAVVRMTARLASDNPAIRDLARDLDEARQARDDTQLAIGQIKLDDAAALGKKPSDADALRGDLLAADNRVKELERALQAQFPRYGALVAPTPVSQAELVQALHPGEGVLRVVGAPEASYTFLIKADGSIAANRSSLGDAALTERIRTLRTALTFTSGSVVPFDVEASHAFYVELMGPVADRLDGVQHLVVVPDGPLLSLPFAVFVRTPSTGQGYTQVDWLGRDVALSVMPSLRSFVRARTDLTASTASRPFLGIGDPDFAGQGASRAAVEAALAACQDRGVFDPTVLRALPALPETRDELKRVAKALGERGSEIITGDAATVQTVEHLDLAQFRIISFATHGLLAGDLKCRTEPALVLTPPPAPSAGDGLLDASEVASLKLDADWVVLSACNTAGAGAELGGEALSGLATAFTYAGARALLASHWDVSSDATVELMIGTFQATRANPGAGRAAALQTAQRQLIAQPDFAHPAFWAPFVLIGDGGSTAAAPRS